MFDWLGFKSGLFVGHISLYCGCLALFLAIVATFVYSVPVSQIIVFLSLDLCPDFASHIKVY